MALEFDKRQRAASTRTMTHSETTEKPSVCATTRASSFPQPGIPVRQTTRTGCEETEGSLKRFRRFRWIPRRGQKTRLTRTLDETDDPEAARETCRSKEDRGDEDPLSPTMATERDGNQQKSDKTEGHRHFGEVTDRAVDELEFEQRVPGKCLEDSDRPRSERDRCGRELEERDFARCDVTELHPNVYHPTPTKSCRRNSVAEGTRHAK